MSSDKHDKKHRKKRVSPYDDDSEVKFNKSTNFHYYDNPAYGENDLIELEKQNNK
jgi:hypothetical protein